MTQDNKTFTTEELRLEIVRIIFDTGSDYQKKEWVSHADEIFAWVTKVADPRSSKTARKKADQKS
tara:strand:+ start:311 stop:505 length:195 start_codon:yes stop_codon:yes gene_type:complete